MNYASAILMKMVAGPQMPRLQTRLADLGTFDMVGQTSTPGFGSLDMKVNERSKEQVMQYDHFIKY